MTSFEAPLVILVTSTPTEAGCNRLELPLVVERNCSDVNRFCFYLLFYYLL